MDKTRGFYPFDVGSIPTESSDGSVAQSAEARGLRPCKYRFESYDSYFESVTQSAEVAVSKTAWCRFDSCCSHCSTVA